MFASLNFPEIEARFSKSEKGDMQIFDIVRKKSVDLTPEEWVRQHVIHFLIHHKNYPLSLIGVEKQLKLNHTIKRTDVVVYDSQLKPLLLIECKADSVSLNQSTIDQALRYNLELNVPFLLLTNGLKHVCLHLSDQGQANYLKDIPEYKELLSV